MGERGQIKFENSGVYLYTHWEGDTIKEKLKTALSKRWRWNDEEYLTRIVFDVMVHGLNGEETGFGIGTVKRYDLNYPLLVVDVKQQKIKEEDKEWSFDEFLEEGIK